MYIHICLSQQLQIKKGGCELGREWVRGYKMIGKKERKWRLIV